MAQQSGQDIFARLAERGEDVIGRIACSTFSFSFRTASAVMETGGSIAVSVRSWSRWFWNMSRTTPACS